MLIAGSPLGSIQNMSPATARRGVRRSQRRTEEVIRAQVLRLRPQIVFAAELRLEFHRNTCTMVSLCRKGCLFRLRLHEVFMEASPRVLECVVEHFFSTRRDESRSAREAIFDFLESSQTLISEHASGMRWRAPLGRVYDLAAVQESIRCRFLPSCPALEIGWADRPSPTLMGKWVAMPKGRPNLVIVNPLLDSRRVPQYYVRYIVFHELLHEVIPIRREGGRWIHHPTEFRRREREFPDFQRALQWEQQNVPKLFQAHVRRQRLAPRGR